MAKTRTARQLEAEEEIRQRKVSSDSLLEFTAYTHPSWDTGEHHKLICEHLEAVERGDIDRLMVFAPPRHSKSELASRRFPAWCLGKHPEWQIINAAYGGDLATDVGADVRDILRDPQYGNVFQDVQLRADARAAGRWRTEQGGIFFACGVGGPVVGRGGHLIIIDDPVKGREEAESPRIKQVTREWYYGNLITRLMPGGRIVLMMTRWAEDDLAGSLLENEADEWTVLELPAIENEDTPEEEALWPGRYPIEALQRTRSSMMKGGRAREWGAQYQQRPTADLGTYCKRMWFSERYDEKPDFLRIYMASDLAVTKEQEQQSGRGPDYTEHGVFGMGVDDEVYPVDWWYGRTGPDEWIEAWMELVKKWKPGAWFSESGVIRRATEGLIEKSMRENHTYTSLHWIASITDKIARGRAFQARAKMGLWHFPKTPWANRVIDQCVAFPGGSFDDAFDTCSLFGRMVAEAHEAIDPTPKPKKPVDRWAKKTGGKSGWKTA